MQGGFDNERFVSEDWFRREQEQVFSKLWIFYCPLAMVDRPNRFVTRDIAGTPVVVQNFDGEIRAFRNVCLHRQMKLQREDFGERRLICPYHGWRYDGSGALSAVPLNREYHQLDEPEVGRAKLQDFRLEIVGQMVFINLADNPLPITEQFSAPLLADIASASESFDREVLMSKIVCDFNWKLIYENLRDVIHARFLHAQTLTQEVLIEPHELPANHAELATRIPDLIELSSGGAIHPLVKDLRPSYAPKVERWGDTDAYFNWLLFPNTHVISPNGGYVFSIEHHVPIAPDKTEIVIYYIAAKSKGALPGSVLWEHMKGAKAVLDEDHQAMEDVQKVVGRGPKYAILGAGEHEISAMQNWMSARMGRSN